MLAEKSHNLITQASMRKQLSAPEYLEKRKLDRERRKSFENGIRGRLKKASRKNTIPDSRSESRECDCTQVSAEKGTDYTCDNCYVDLCSDCETELTKDKVPDKCACRNEDGELVGEKCPECDRSLHYIDSGSAEQLERKPSDCRCSDFKSSQESFSKDSSNSLNKTRGYHSSDNIVGYTDSSKSREDLSEANNSLLSVRNIQKTCLKCAKIKENIAVTDSSTTIHSRKSRCNDIEKKTDTLRSKSREDPQRSKLSKIGTWRRKSEPGLPPNTNLAKKSQDSDSEKNETRGFEKIEFECRNCGSNKITKKLRNTDGTIISDPELDGRKRIGNGSGKLNVEIRMYNTKNIPKKISKLKKNRAKGLRLGSDTTAKFYADFSTDVSTENILHISESNDSLNVDKSKDNSQSSTIPETISKDEDIDEETYKKLIEKTDSFKKNELEKVKYLNKQKVITEGTEVEEKASEVNASREEIPESCEESEQPLEQIISQLLMQNREFQKLLKKQQLRNSAIRRHQRLLKSHSNPEHVILARNFESAKLKPKYGRQTSENLDINNAEDRIDSVTEPHTRIDVDNVSDDEHIYETLRVENRDDESLHTLNNKSKIIQHHTHLTRPKRLPSPPHTGQVIPDAITTNAPESDYVYLSFDKLNNLQDADGIYDVPVKSPEKVDHPETSDYYVSMEHQGPANLEPENIYDNLLEVCRRKKNVPDSLPGEYLPMSPDQQSPNAPEIWLSRQKEHFNVSRDRKSGSLPRSFQVVTNTQEETNSNTFICKPHSNSKTYLNRDGKVMSTDRPFTIASDKSEISYDDVENYMSEGDILKFNKNNKSDAEYPQNISQSTLELEEEIDRCYKSNFEEINLDKNKNENLLTVSQPNLNTSTASSCEVLPLDPNEEKPNEIEVIHPEHKIYKPTTNMLSLRNVLSRFKNKTPNKNNDDLEVNANEQSSPDSGKSDLKSPTNEKRSALNPRSYSKNLLQRFKSIIGDEPSDDNQNRTEVVNTQISKEDTQNNLLKSEIKVVITSTDVDPTTSITQTNTNEILSKSVCENSTLTESQNEKNNIDALSNSCDNINKKREIFRPTYEKSVSMVTNISSSIGSTSSPSKSNNSSYHSLNKLPIYMQGSKHLGARIAQSDYVDPMTLVSEKSSFKNINVLINKNAVRPDSLFSNSSFVTSSSEGTYQECQFKTNPNSTIPANIDSPVQANSDESFYEKSFEKIEHVTDEDVFRDSAVYSDQEEGEEVKVDPSSNKVVSKVVTRVESIKRNASFKTQKRTVTDVNEKISTTHTNTRVTIITTNKAQHVEKHTEQKEEVIEKTKSKIAPPVPVKPKMSNIPSSASFQTKTTNIVKSNSLLRNQDQAPSSETVNMRTIKRNTNFKPGIIRSESTPNDKAKMDEEKSKAETKEPKDIDASKQIKPPGNIHMKRLSFERASLDSATRKIKLSEVKRPNEPPKMASKSVLERRMEIELMSKSQVGKPSQIVKRPSQMMKPKPLMKAAPFERSVSENGSKESPKITPSSSSERENLPSNRNSCDVKPESIDDLKGSWVKQVVNKFQ